MKRWRRMLAGQLYLGIFVLLVFVVWPLGANKVLDHVRAFLFIPLPHHCPNPILTGSHAFRLDMKPFQEVESVGEAVLSEVRADSHITTDTNFVLQGWD